MHSFLIGKGGASKKQIEQASGARLNIPRRDDPRGSPVVILGPSKAAVAQARRGARLLAAPASRRMQPTACCLGASSSTDRPPTAQRALPSPPAN